MKVFSSNFPPFVNDDYRDEECEWIWLKVLVSYGDRGDWGWWMVRDWRAVWRLKCGGDWWWFQKIEEIGVLNWGNLLWVCYRLLFSIMSSFGDPFSFTMPSLWVRTCFSLDFVWTSFLSWLLWTGFLIYGFCLCSSVSFLNSLFTALVGLVYYFNWSSLVQFTCARIV